MPVYLEITPALTSYSGGVVAAQRNILLVGRSLSDGDPQ